ncbi:hypothetical protein QC762_0040960 [Podospora pseudocomata]|uniref:Uncharacterized protein n=1 Tax=Podospora pseudocomata TaxID=2093779 RepID=A0ABR0GMQ3_9PEZI|nr:hypothetical protein QC762_0040960 [Podospora pseudocomata]
MSFWIVSTARTVSSSPSWSNQGTRKIHQSTLHLLRETRTKLEPGQRPC